MDRFEVHRSNRAEKDYRKMPSHIRVRIDGVQMILKTSPVPARQYDIVKLEGVDDTYRVRIGGIRVIYVISRESRGIIIDQISFRGGAYK